MKKKVMWTIIIVAIVAIIAAAAIIVIPMLGGEPAENPGTEPDPVVDNPVDEPEIDPAEIDAKIEEYRQVILVEPQNVDASINLIKAYAQKGDIAAARAEADRIMTLMPTEYRIYDTMLAIYEGRGEYITAADFIETIPYDIKGRYQDKLRKEGHGLYAGYGNTSGNLTNYGWVCIDGDTIYYSEKRDGQALYRADLDGKNKAKLSDRPTQDINVIGDTVYFVDSKEYKICAVKTDGSDEKVLLDAFGQRLFVIGDRLYYVNWGDGCKIYSANLDGSDNKMAIDISADHVSLSGAWLYFQDRDQMESIAKVKIDGTGEVLLNEVNCLFVNAAGEYIYYANWGDEGKLYRCINDMTEEPVALTESKVGYINLYGDWIYFVDWIDDQHIYRLNIVDGKKECVSQDMAMGIFVKDKYVYYYNELDSDRLYRMDLDGSNRMRVGQ